MSLLRAFHSRIATFEAHLKLCESCRGAEDIRPKVKPSSLDAYKSSYAHVPTSYGCRLEGGTPCDSQTLLIQIETSIGGDDVCN
jgi:hypothetical protein